MRTPSVVIVGRPNVGKSSLFNAIVGGQVAIVEPTAGVTRDRLSRQIERDGTAFELVDTGGIGIEEELAEHIGLQIHIAIEQADLVLLVVDARDGLQPLDSQVADALRRAEKQVLLVVNKCDNPKDEAAAADFYTLGFDRLYMASATQRLGIADLVDAAIARLPRTPPAEEPEPMKIAFVGRRNVGKSTLVNYLAQESRVLVSEIPGTTRDAVDVRFRIDDMEFVAIDTAGVRHRRQLKDSIEFYSATRSFGSIRRADVVVHVMEAPMEIARIDKKLARQISDEHKPCVLAMNKTDLAGGTALEKWKEYVYDRLTGMSFAPLVCISAQTGENVLELIQTAQALHEQSFVRVSTGELNRAVQEMTGRVPPPLDGSRRARIYYATQVAVKPPTIALFTNFPELITSNYKRYLANRLREQFAYTSIPIRFFVRGKKNARAPHDR